MARMIPQRNTIQNRGERQIYELLKDCPKDWYVFHSYTITRNQNRDEKEIDFIVLAPSLGVFILEVKQGTISCHDGNWYQNGRLMDKSPFEQAAKGMHDLVQEIQPMVPYFTHGYGVVFLDTDEFPVNSLQEEQWKVFDKRNNDNIHNFIRNLSLHNRHDLNQPALHDKDIPAIVGKLRPDYDIPLTKIIRGTNEIIAKLTNEQYDKLDEIEENHQVLIKGSAGTGKTFLAMEATRRSCLDKKRVGLFCYNTILGNWYQTQLEENDYLLYRGSLHDLMFKHIHDTGTSLLTPDKKDFFSESKKAKSAGFLYPKSLSGAHDFWEKDVPESMLNALQKKPLQLDKIVLDECQDLLIDGYLRVFNKLLVGGLKSGNWCFFGDYNQQSVHNTSGGDLDSAIKKYTHGHHFISKLLTNCRNTKKIADEIVKITGFGTNKTREEISNIAVPDVAYYQWNDDTSQKELLENIVRNFHENNIANTDIVLLAANRPIKESVVNKVSFPTQDYDDHYSGKIRFSTIRRYKGLESPIVIITDVTSYENRELLYQGMSRASSILVILESEKATSERLQGNQ
ncbi:MAG: NERD domain-containing protein [Prevotella sp.]|jgi:hypothetical protein|nr:NERD domain-containing protein [Prevotella sp.]